MEDEQAIRYGVSPEEVTKLALDQASVVGFPVRTFPPLSAIAQNVVDAQSIDSSCVDPSMSVRSHAFEPPVGFVEMRTSPELSIAMHSEADGQVTSEGNVLPVMPKDCQLPDDVDVGVVVARM